MLLCKAKLAKPFSFIKIGSIQARSQLTQPTLGKHLQHSANLGLIRAELANLWQITAKIDRIWILNLGKEKT